MRCEFGYVKGISIHALLAESDDDQNWASSSGPLFLSTLSLRRATYVFAAGNKAGAISIHALLAESDYVFAAGNKAGAISIHALLAESDAPRVASLFGRCYFYPRSPCGERRCKVSCSR